MSHRILSRVQTERDSGLISLADGVTFEAAKYKLLLNFTSPVLSVFAPIVLGSPSLKWKGPVCPSYDHTLAPEGPDAVTAISFPVMSQAIRSKYFNVCDEGIISGAIGTSLEE